MQRLNIDLVTVGMILGRDIVHSDGSILMEEGTVINDSSLRRFIMSGILHIIVRDKPVPGATMGYDVRGRLKNLPHLFRKYENDEFMNTLRNMLHNHFAERI